MPSPSPHPRESPDLSGCATLHGVTGSLPSDDVDVVAAAIVRHGRVLAARRVQPTDVAGGWELPGGKVDVDETAEDAVVREIREELGCAIEIVGSLGGRVPIKPGYTMTVKVARLASGDPVPHEHDAVRWLGPEELDDVAWLEADRPFLPELRERLLDGHLLDGGNVGGARRIGPTVRRATGPWSASVHRLVAHLRRSGLVEVPPVYGADARGREVLGYLPGRVPDVDTEVVHEDTLADAMRWLRRFHDAVAEYRPSGTWRTTHRALGTDEIICHHDFAPYNVALSSSADGERVVGVFDWDMAGPGRPIDDLAFAAWNWVPLFRDVGASVSAVRLEVMAAAYSGVAAAEILDHVAPRLQRSLDVIAAGQAAGDPGMLQLRTRGEPDRSALALAALVDRLPAIRAASP